MVEPEGAFYIFVQAPNGDEQALLQAAHACNILLVGGAAFGYPGYARISFCVSFEKINRSLTAFEKMADLLGIGR
jgi:aspartate aminotransferase